SKIPELAETIDNLVTNMTALNCTNYLNDPRLLDDIMIKMPLFYQLEWIDYTELRAEITSINDLNDWFKLMARKMRRVVKGTGREHVMLHEAEFKQQTTFRDKILRKFNCPDCGNNHSLTQCSSFKEKSIGDKWDTVKAAKLCHGCLRFSNHQIQNCKLWKGCGVNGCTKRHHPLLHKTKRTAKKHHVQHHDTTNEKKRIYYQITPVTLRNGPLSVKTYAFLDPGSSLTLLDEEVAGLLELEGVSDPLRMKWTGDIQACDMTSRRVKLSTINVDKLKHEYPHLKNVPVNSYTNVRPTMLIGLKHSHLIVPLNRRKGYAIPIAIETKLGWMIFGNEEIISNDIE
uniref:Peptidase aspartic putative domain-containing protein n=1 Tax=Anopheles funestus TaxID=62324 RepID=A0A182RLZ1_ANOFN